MVPGSACTSCRDQPQRGLHAGQRYDLSEWSGILTLTGGTVCQLTIVSPLRLRSRAEYFSWVVNFILRYLKLRYQQLLTLIAI